MLERLKCYWQRITYYRFVDNWHKHPYVSRVLCRMGAHDVEHFDTLYDTDGEPEGSLLECFYCGHRKQSIFHLNKDE